MASIDNIEDISPINQYTATASQTVFDYSFPITDEADLVVYDNDTLQVLTTNYTVTGVGEDNGGSITFTSGRSAGSTITIYRDIAIERTTDFQQNGPFTSASVNDELDKITMVLQQLERDIGRSVRMTLRNAQASSELEIDSSFAGRYLYINEDGELEPATAVTATALTQSIIAALLTPQTEVEAAAGVTPTNYAYPECHINRYGTNATPGTTDMTTAIQAAFDVAYHGGGDTVYGDAETYLYTSNILPQINGTTSRSFRLKGKGMELTKFVTNNASSFKFYADTPPARSNAFVSLEIDGCSITNTGTAYTGIGLDIYSMQRSMISNVRVTGFNYGAYIRSSWNNTIDKRCQFDGNNVGIKVPRAGSGSTLNEGFNSILISGISAANNKKAGISIANGNVVTIQNLLGESNPVVVYLVEGLKKVTLEDIYFEAGSVTKTEVNRAGSDQCYTVYAGKDEDDNLGDTSLPVRDLDLRHVMRDDGNGAVYLNNVNGVHLPNDEIGRGYVTFGTSVQNIVANTISGDDARSSPMVATKGRPTARNVLRSFPANWIPNGNFSLPSIPVTTITGSGVTAAFSSAQSMDGSVVRTLDITVPNGITAASVRFDVLVPTGSEFASIARTLYGSIHAVAGSSDFSSCTLEILDQGAAVASATKSSALSSAWFVLSCEGSSLANVATLTSLSLKITLARTTGTGSAVFSVDEIVLGDTARAQVGVFGATDLEIGLSGTVTCSTSSGSWYYGDVSTPFTDPSHFDAQLTALYDTLQTDTIVQYQKPSGGTLRVWANKSGASVAYRLMPRLMVLP